MEIRAKISLAVEAFTQKVKSVTEGYADVAKAAESADKSINSSAKSSASVKSAAAKAAADNQIAEIRRAEIAAIDSNKRVVASYAAMKPQQLPLPLIQQFVRSTVSPSTSTEGLPKRNTVEEIYAQKKLVQEKINADTAYYQRLAQMSRESRDRQTADMQAVADAKIRADKVMADSKAFHDALNSPDFERNMASIRYALYDVANRATAFAGSIIAAIGTSVQEFAKLESAFTSVERVTLGLSSGALNNLKQSLFDISTSAPIAFEELTKIATLGGQMGISADSLDEFAQTVAKFSTVTGISADQAAQSFGRLAQMMDVPVSKFENLSSAVLYAGVNSVATDREILAMAESIASAGAQSGMSADQVIGLSTALASLKVRPEEARGVILRLFRTIDAEVSNAGPRLNDFASVLGLVGDASASAGEKAAALWKQDSSKFFTSFIQGASAAGDLNGVLASIGITGTREVNVVSKLAGSVDVLTKGLSDARKEYLLGQYASKAFATAQDDLNSKFKMLQAAIAQFESTMGEAIAGPVGFFVDALKEIAKVGALIPGPVKAIAVALGLVAAAIAMVTAGVAFGIAGLLAYKLAFDRLNMSGTGVGINMKTLSALFKEMTGTVSVTTMVTNGFSNALMKVGVSEMAAANSTNRLSTAMKGLQASMGWIGLLLTVATVAWTVVEAVNQANEKVAKLGDAMIESGGGSEELSKALAKDAETYNKTGEAIGKLSYAYSDQAIANEKLAASQLGVAEYADATVTAIRDSEKSLGDFSQGSEIAADAQDKFNKTVDAGNTLLGEQEIALGSNTAAFIASALAKYGENQDQSFYKDLLDPENAAAKADAELLGFNIANMIAAGLKKEGGATDYVTEISGAMQTLSAISGQTDEQIALSVKDLGAAYGWTSAKVAEMTKLTQDGKFTVTSIGPDFFTAAQAVDAFRGSVEQSAAANEIQKQTLIDQGLSAVEATDIVEGLSEQLKNYLSSTIDAASANLKTADSFSDFAAGIKDTKGEMSGLSKAASQNIGNFQDFMTTALDAAIAKGEGFNGALARIVGGLLVLEKAGKGTGEGFKTLQTWMSTAIGSQTEIVGASTLATQVMTATSVAGLNIVIQKWIDAQDATSDAGKKAIAYAEGLRSAMTGTFNGTDFAKMFQDSWNGAAKTATKAKTALELLQAQIEKTFKSMRNNMSLRSALADLGASMAENGKEFSQYSEGGRANIDSLLTSIDELAMKSGGNLQKFANSLASLKAALIAAGASASAIAIIDKEIKATGKTAKKSTAEVNSFAAAIKTIGDDELLATAAAAEKLASKLGSLFSAVIAGRKASLDMASGYEQMQSKVADARREIESINATISELTAKKGTLEYQLSIALKYGDTLRANTIKAEIDKVKADITGKNADIAAQQQIITPTTATSQLELLNTMESQANKIYSTFGTLVAQGKMTQTELRTWADTQSQLYYDQAIAAGVAEADAILLAGTIKKDLYDAIKKVPKVTVDTKAAMANVAALQSAINGIKGKTVTVTTVYQSLYVSSADKVPVKKAAAGGYIAGPGTGTSDSIPAMLSNGEFVMSAAAVRNYGVDFMNSLNQMSGSSSSMPSAMSQMSNTQSQVVYLSPDDRQLLRAAIDRPVTLYADSTRLASSVNDGNVLLAQRGSN